jgi:hypothetical protein
MNTPSTPSNVEALSTACDESSLFRAIVDVSQLLTYDELQIFRRWLNAEPLDAPSVHERGRLPALQRASVALRVRERHILRRSFLALVS